MNILIIPSWYPSKSEPLNGSFFREQALALAKTGNNVIILNATLNSRKSYLDSNNFRHLKYDDEGLKVYSYNVPSFGIYKIKSLLYIVFRHNMFKVFNKIKEDFNEIDIIHAHSFMPAGKAACDLGKRYNIPVVVTEHSSSVIKKKLSNLELDYLKQTVEKSNKILCVSNALKKSIIELTKTNKAIKVIPNMVSSIFNFDYQKVENDDFTFISVGNLIESKRHEITINAFSEAFRGKKAKLQIIGEGLLSNKLHQQINDLKMGMQIELLGSLSREETAKRIKKSDAFVLASSYETFGIAYIEAMACGKPVIGMKNGGAQDIINSQNGVLVDVDNAMQLSDAMKYVWLNRKQFNDEMISIECLNKYNGFNISNRLINIYVEVRNEKQKE